MPQDERRVRPKLDDLAKGVVVSSWNPDQLRRDANEQGYALEMVDVKEIMKEVEKSRMAEVEQGV